MTRYAVILQATVGTGEFRPTFGFYNKQLHDLKQAGYEILKIDMDNPISLQQKLSNFPQSSVGFLWLRMHGSPKSMAASNNFTITLKNINEIFLSLPAILNEDATVFLDSCSTGSLQTDFNNMQFAFAKLTLQKPQVKIVAPSEDSHISYFSILNNGSFNFEIQASPNSAQNIAVVLGQKTKEIINAIMATKASLESKEEELKNSLCRNNICPFLENFKKEKKAIMFGSSFDLTTMMTKAIMKTMDSSTALKQVKELIEVFHASPNPSIDSVLPVWERATPLSVAVYFKRPEIVIYLLQQDADLFFTLKGETIVDLAKQRDEQNDDDDEEKDMDELIISRRRKRENDHSKIFNVITNHLASKQEKNMQVESISFYSKQSFWTQPSIDSTSSFSEREAVTGPFSIANKNNIKHTNSAQLK